MWRLALGLALLAGVAFGVWLNSIDWAYAAACCAASVVGLLAWKAERGRRGQD
jgi:hypothetical protein